MTLPTVHDRVRDKQALAATYARDGAFLTAAQLLREAAAEYETHGEARNDALRAGLAQLQGEKA